MFQKRGASKGGEKAVEFLFFKNQAMVNIVDLEENDLVSKL